MLAEHISGESESRHNREDIVDLGRRICNLLRISTNLAILVSRLKRIFVVQNFSKALRIGFISFNLSSLDKGCCRFEHFRLALFKNCH